MHFTKLFATHSGVMQGNQLIERSIMNESMLDKRYRPEEDFFADIESNLARFLDIEEQPIMFANNHFFETE